jgi:CheY-like chemotaxis protein
LTNPGYILIAEDDEDDQFLLRLAFQEIGGNTELVFVENGIDLINHFKKVDKGDEKLPSLLIVDLNMPKKNGREAIKELSEKEFYNNFPTVIFSTTGNDLERTRCQELGISNFFVKPSSYNHLLDLVHQFTRIASDSMKRFSLA